MFANQNFLAAFLRFVVVPRTEVARAEPEINPFMVFFFLSVVLCLCAVSDSLENVVRRFGWNGDRSENINHVTMTEETKQQMHTNISIITFCRLLLL